MSAILVVLSMPGREQLTARTLAELDSRGAAGWLSSKYLFWTALERPRFDLHGWGLIWRQHAPRGGRVDYWEMLRSFPPGFDLVVLEDDVQPCRNFVRYAYEWQTPKGAAFTTFYNGRSVETGRVHHALGPDRRGFWFSQALKLPSWFTASAVSMAPLLEGIGAPDMALGYVADQLGTGVYYHRSLVQHVGEASVGAPGAQLVGKRAPAADFVGADFDALTLR